MLDGLYILFPVGSPDAGSLGETIVCSQSLSSQETLELLFPVASHEAASLGDLTSWLSSAEQTDLLVLFLRKSHILPHAASSFPRTSVPQAHFTLFGFLSFTQMF
jgi:hypothetical protein